MISGLADSWEMPKRIRESKTENEKGREVESGCSREPSKSVRLLLTYFFTPEKSFKIERSDIFCFTRSEAINMKTSVV